MSTTIVSYYDWNRSIANKYGDDWDDEEGGLRCAGDAHNGSTFELSDGSIPLAANGTVTEVTWTAQVATNSGIEKSDYTFKHVHLYKNGWKDVKGWTNVSSWVEESPTSGGGVSARWGIYDGTIDSPSTFSGLSGKTIRVRISIKNDTSQISLLRKGQLIITWKQPEIAYTKPSVTLNSVNSNYAPSKEITVSWNGTAGTNNNISKYEYIYKDVEEVPSSSTSGISTGITASVKITTPSTTAGNNTSKYFYVKPYGTNSSYNGSWTGPLTITSYYTNISWSKNFKISGYTDTIYIGTSGSPKGKLTWDSATAGSNNNISSYKFYKDSTEIASYDKESYTLSTGTYKVQVTPEIGNVISSNSITVKKLSNLTKPSFSSTLKTTVDSDFNFTITSLNKSDFSGVNSITQKVERIYNGSIKTITLTNNSGTCSVGDITNDTTFQLKITTTYNDNFGGYTTETYTTSDIKKIKKIEAPSDFIQYIGEKNDDTTTGTNNLFFMSNFYVRYKNLNKGLTSAKYKYEMYYQIGNESYISTPLTSNTNTSDTYGKFTFSSNFDHAGKLITFYIKITDTVTGSFSSTTTFQIRSLKPPTIDSVTASIKNLQNELVNFTINYKSNMDASVGDMTLLLNFMYKGVKGKSSDYTYTLTMTDQAAEFPSKTVGDYDYSCIENNDNITGFYNELLQDVYPSIGAGIYNPDLQLWARIEYKDYPDCFVETIKSFDNWPNYMQENPSFDNSFYLLNQKDFYNPLDTLTLTRGNLLLTKTRTDGTALVTAKPQEIRYILKYQNQNKDFTNQQIDLTAPKAVQDDNISIGFVSEVVYENRKGETITKQYSNNGTSMEYIYINLAKWNENIVPFLSNCFQLNGKIEGKINFESDKVYSKRYYNLKNIKYEIYQKDQSTAEVSKTITINSLTVPTSENFSFDYEKEESVDIYAKITYTNTSDRTFLVETLRYIVRTENLVPLALRKKGIALNVEPTFDLTSRGSSIFAAAASDDVAILELQANNEATNPKFLHFLNGGSSIGNIYYNESDSLLHCDKWYYPVTEINSKTGKVELNASDVHARPEDWLPDGVASISGGTIRGAIEITKYNGETGNIRINGLGSMAFENKANFIRYSYDEPTENLAQGQIWLKPIE